MAWSFPVGLNEFFNGLAVVESTFNLSDNLNTGRTAGGTLVVGEYGERIWYGTVRLRVLPNRSQESVMARVRMIQGARASFFMTPNHIKHHTTGINSAKISDVLTGNAYRLRIKDLAASKALAQGDYVSFSKTGTHYLHQLSESGTADGTGLTPYIEVEPAINPVWAVNDPLDFVTPRCVAKYVPKSLRIPRIRSVLTDGPSFDWEQVL